jgi:predicted nucleotidyltransferase component of viral defense system
MAKSILSQKQKKVLDLLFRQPSFKQKFYLTGGTALAEFYLHHRYSEDLDFFSTEEIDVPMLNGIFKSIRTQIGLRGIDYQQRFNRNLYYLNFENEMLKTEFTFYPGEPILEAKKEGDIKVDSLLDIAVNKTFTIYQNPRSRDFIDLYLMLQQQPWTISDLRLKAKIKFDFHLEPLQLARQIMKVTEAKDYPKMIIDLRPDIWQEFWLEEAKKLKDEILK